MTKFLLFCILFFGLGACSHSTSRGYPDYSESSGFVLSDPDSGTLENLDVLGRVWGYVKYHHPVFAANDIDADYELFGLLPRVAQADKQERNRLLGEWIESLGSYEADSTFYSGLFSNEDHRWLTRSEWITPERLGPELCNALRKMKYTPRKSNRYIRPSMGADNPELTNEHSGGRIEDCGYRLLWLYRYWNIIEYFCPNRNSTDQEWDSVLTDFLPRFIEAKDADTFWPEYARLNAALCDGHAFGAAFALTGTRRLAAQARYFGDRLIVTQAGNFARGDEIVAIDGQTPGQFLERMRPYIAASNPETAASYASVLALCTPKDTVEVDYIHAGQPRSARIRTLSSTNFYTFANKSDSSRSDSCRLLNDKVGYLYAGSYHQTEAAEIMDKFRDTKALIVDLRCYPGEFMIFDFVGRYFIESPVSHVIFGIPEVKMPGLMRLKKDRLTIGWPDQRHNPAPYKGRVIVLCNESTQSQAEYTVMAFQATPRCTVVGSRTAGADGNVSIIPTPFREQSIQANAGASRLFSGLGVYYPDGTDTQRAGVRVDMEVHPTIEGLRAGRDEVLEKALQIAMQE